MWRWRAVLVLTPLTLLSACEVFTEPLGGLELRLIVRADSMVAGEIVRVTISVRNGGAFPLGFSGSGSCTIGMEVVRPDGSVTGRPSVCTSDLRTWTLEPGDSLIVERTWGTFSESGVPPAGTYRLRPYVDAREDERVGRAVAIEILPSARAAFVHTDRALPPLDLVVGGRRAVAGATYGSPPRSGFAAAGHQTVEIRRAGLDVSVARAGFELEQGKDYLFAVREGPAGPEPWLITDPDTVSGPSQTRLRLIDLALGAPPFTVRATAPDGGELEAMPSLSYGVAWPYLPIEPGWWRFAATGTNPADTLAWWSLRLLGGQVRTLVLLDGDTGGIVGILLDP